MKKVYMVKVNADMTEGRGPMIDEKCFETLELAKAWVTNRSGVMGVRSELRPSLVSGVICTGNDRDIVEVLVYDYVPPSDDNVKQRALAKLTDEEKRVLRLS